MTKEDKTSGPDMEMEKVHWSEWMAGGISALLIFSLLGWIVYDIWRYNPQEADFIVGITAVNAVENGYRVTFSVTNITQTTAAQVRVVGVLDDRQGKAEASTTMFNYVASEAKANGALFFESNPTDYLLKVRVESYIEP
ncbi:TIGR02588 family protein [Ochrobactrum quorumnocens]|uniref:TIGR02588 family protein n=1 Tax=Ochrobactrum quorumnocens TaxID=271865 RepID=UPI000A5F421C|nr:TIGR02588 family protein [[Ochrobactrum] quorumnocens]